ncbi:hypothetical protein [Streptomyces caniscabiei]|uniref:hypothetical protein n=1 Tax=Streptomyces caniscabiei TaxID=2746961 RepID=UPI00118012AF|nr:hypothetical protein [Streptomyces caniscabiei]
MTLVPASALASGTAQAARAWGEAQNSRTGGAVARVHGSAGDELASCPANNGVYAVNWGPVYSLRNC